MSQTATKSTKQKDQRVTYNQQEIELEGNVVRFDGKYNPANDTLKVYRYYGDVGVMLQAIEQFCILKGYGNSIIKA